ncbi:MAG: site-2 protease family protein [Chlamydiales bacterium]
MIQIPGRIPIFIYPTFWIVAALIGYVNSMSLMGTVIWIGIIFVSVLFHEFGHALTALLFGKNPRIELVAFGGLTYHEGEDLPFWKQFFVVLNGPLFGFILFLISTALLHFFTFENEMLLSALKSMQWVNLFWTLLNLLPVLPLDGGQLLRVICEGFWGIRGFKYALLASMLIGTGLSLFFFLNQYFLVGAIFFLLAFQSFDTWKKSRSMSGRDRDKKLKNLLDLAEKTFHDGDKEKAKQLFEEVRTRAKEGMIYLLATQYLAYILYEEGNSKAAYDLLLPIQDELASDALCLLHKAAFDKKNFPLVVQIGGVCFQTWPSVETALRNACAAAVLKDLTACIGWLQTALKEGLENLPEVLQEEYFDEIRQDPAFKQRFPLE